MIINETIKSDISSNKSFLFTLHMIGNSLRHKKEKSSLLKMSRFQLCKQITSPRRIFTRTYLPRLVKSSFKDLEVKSIHDAVFSYLVRHSRVRSHMQKPQVHETRSRPLIFNLNIDVFRKLLDYLDPIDQLCLSATCKLFFDLLWPLMQK